MDNFICLLSLKKYSNQQPTVQGKEEKMTHYTTQMDAARQGIITPQMEIVAEKKSILM